MIKDKSTLESQRLLQHNNQSVWEVFLEEYFVGFVDNPIFFNHPIYNTVKEMFNKGVLWSVGLKLLFQPGSEIKRLISTIEENLSIKDNTFKIGLHIRQGDDSFGKTGKKDERYVPSNRVPCFVEKAIQLWEEASKKKELALDGQPIFFVTSDHETTSQEVIEIFRRKGYRAFDSVEYAGNPVHMKKKKEDQTRTFLDWFLLSRMDELVITRSGFSMSPAKFNCVPSYIYMPSNKTCLDIFNPMELCSIDHYFKRK